MSFINLTDFRKTVETSVDPRLRAVVRKSPLVLTDMFFHTFEYDFMLNTIKQDKTKAIQLSKYIITSTIYSALTMRNSEITSIHFISRNWNLRTVPHHRLKCVTSTYESSSVTIIHFSMSASTIREVTLHR